MRNLTDSEMTTIISGASYLDGVLSKIPPINSACILSATSGSALGALVMSAAVYGTSATAIIGGAIPGAGAGLLAYGLYSTWEPIISHIIHNAKKK